MTAVTDEELKRLFDTIRLENVAAHAETRRHFDVVAERLDARIGGLTEWAAALDEKTDP